MDQSYVKVDPMMERRCSSPEVAAESQTTNNQQPITAPLKKNSTQQPKNIFLDKNKRILTYPIPILLENFTFERNVDTNEYCYKIQIGDSLVRLPLLCSGGRPDAFAIDLTSLIDLDQKLHGSTLRHVAFLVIWEQLTESIS
ncbi:unnamed protein product [Echinostoma caproni]|uniref:Uncharacterized protein n=1 Tax=Echinostoma caproni TaxID=27848 RepID=A0A183AIT3_9TREM|nr:unnamed protein product [Echinostoma caproni]